jgi:hypothetical protein
MKTLIIAFWTPDPSTGGESGAFRLHKSMFSLIKDEVTYLACFKEETFKENGKPTEASKIKFIKDFVFEQFLFTKCQVMIIVINELLKDAFLKKIGYHKSVVSKSEPAPAISGEVFGDDDKIFIYLQDKRALGFFSSRCTVVSSKGGALTLKMMSSYRFN